MEILYAIVHKEQGLVIKIVQDVFFNEDGSILLTETPDVNRINNRSLISELSSLTAQMIDIIKFDYDSVTREVSGYYEKLGDIQPMSFNLDPTNHFLLNNNGLYWRNNQLET